LFQSALGPALSACAGAGERPRDSKYRFSLAEMADGDSLADNYQVLEELGRESGPVEDERLFASHC
jgi:hypothetical protein